MIATMNLSKPRNAQSGVVLLEALIAVLIFSFGVLGIVGLQATMLAGVADAKYRTEASFFANRLLGEMAAADRDTTAAMTTFATGGARYNTWYNDIRNINVTAGLLGLPGVTATANAPTVTINTINNPAGRPVRHDVTINVFWQAPGQPMHRHVVTASITTD